jgi:hypothetical protein
MGVLSSDVVRGELAGYAAQWASHNILSTAPQLSISQKAMKSSLMIAM